MRVQALSKRSPGFVFAAVVMLVVFATACRKSPEPAPETPGDQVPSSMQPTPVTELAGPQDNPVLGVRVESTPPGLVVSYNDQEWLMLVERASPNVMFIVEVDRTRAPVDLAGAAGEFEAMIKRYPDGELLGNGTLEDSQFGPARWAAGSYSEDGEKIEEIRLFTTHPSGSGMLIVYARYPQGSGSVDGRLAQLEAVVAGFG
ncbi:MAG: hypothetical protein ACC742_02030 [Thermoanaerobaculales bacterium]